MAQYDFNTVVTSLLKGMDGIMDSHTVIGDATQIGDTYIIPLVDVSFGMGAGAGGTENKRNGSGGFAAKMTPSAVLLIKDGHTRLINVKNTDALIKILDMVPDMVDRFTGKAPDIQKDKAKDIAFGDKKEETREDIEE